MQRIFSALFSTPAGTRSFYLHTVLNGTRRAAAACPQGVALRRNDDDATDATGRRKRRHDSKAVR